MSKANVTLRVTTSNPLVRVTKCDVEPCDDCNPAVSLLGKAWRWVTTPLYSPAVAFGGYVIATVAIETVRWVAA